MRFDFDSAPPYETLMLHFCGELRLTQWYLRAASWHTEPLIKQIYTTLAADEARHAGAYFRYMQRAVDREGDTAREAFVKVGLLMAQDKARRPLHPTNLHVNKSLFPNDTIQSRLPDPHWLERWLDTQICFGPEAEHKVARTILHKLATLLHTEFNTIKDLRSYRNRFRRPAEPAARAAAQQAIAITSHLTAVPTIKGATMNALSDHVNFAILERKFEQLPLEFDPELGALWARMSPRGRPCYSREFMREVRDCQFAIEATGGKVAHAGKLYDLQYVVLASNVDNVFNLGGDLALFSELVRKQDRDGLFNYAKQCVDISFHHYTNYNLPLTTIALVQGEAMGGGFESAVASSVLIAEKSAKFGLPEIQFNLFPGMGAYTYLGRKVGLKAADELILSGRTFTGAELHALGVVDVLAEDGQGESAVAEYVRRWRRSRNGFIGAQRARQRFSDVTYEELLDTTRIWVDTALKISERDLRMMELLVRKQQRLMGAEEMQEQRCAVA